MSDWQVGDLALCIKAGPRSISFRGAGQRLVVAGGVYAVEHAYVDPVVGWCLVLEGAHSSHITKAWQAASFRKVTPPAADDFDRETIALMNRVGEPVQ